jgi:hypothetical protein
MDIWTENFMILLWTEARLRVKYEIYLKQWNKQSEWWKLSLKNPSLVEVYPVKLVWCAVTVITELLRCTSACFHILGKQKTYMPDVLNAPSILLIYKKDGNRPICTVCNATKQQGTRTRSFIFVMHVPDR